MKKIIFIIGLIVFMIVVSYPGAPLRAGTCYQGKCKVGSYGAPTEYTSMGACLSDWHDYCGMNWPGSCNPATCAY